MIDEKTTYVRYIRGPLLKVGKIYEVQRYIPGHGGDIAHILVKGNGIPPLWQKTISWSVDRFEEVQRGA